MRNFRVIIFTGTQTSRKIFKSALMYLKQMKIPDQAHICLRKYRLYAQNMLIICLYDQANGCQTQRLLKWYVVF